MPTPASRHCPALGLQPWHCWSLSEGAQTYGYWAILNGLALGHCSGECRMSPCNSAKPFPPLLPLPPPHKKTWWRLSDNSLQSLLSLSPPFHSTWVDFFFLLAQSLKYFIHSAGNKLPSCKRSVKTKCQYPWRNGEIQPFMHSKFFIVMGLSVAATYCDTN